MAGRKQLLFRGTGDGEEREVGVKTNTPECRGPADPGKAEEFPNVATKNGCPETKSEVILSHCSSTCSRTPAPHAPKARCSSCPESLLSSSHPYLASPEYAQLKMQILTTLA